MSLSNEPLKLSTNIELIKNKKHEIKKEIYWEKANFCFYTQKLSYSTLWNKNENKNKQWVWIL